MRNYFIAGTLDNALTSLSTSTGKAASDAERNLRIVSGNLTILPESTATDLLTATNAKNTLDRLKNNLTPANTQATQVAALKSLIAIERN